MGRAARECSEPGRDGLREPPRGGRLRRRHGLGLGLTPVDPGLEAEPDLLTRGEQGVVADAAGRELHDADRFIAIAVAACIRRRLVEGPQAIAFPMEPGHPRTPTMSRALWEPGRVAGSRTLQTKRG